MTLTELMNIFKSQIDQIYAINPSRENPLLYYMLERKDFISDPKCELNSVFKNDLVKMLPLFEQLKLVKLDSNDSIPMFSLIVPEV